MLEWMREQDERDLLPPGARVDPRLPRGAGTAIWPPAIPGSNGEIAMPAG